MIKIKLLFLSCISLAAPMASSAAPDAFALWQHGAFRGANVMQAQCTVKDLRVLRAWGANLAEIPVSNVYSPAPPYEFKPENLARLDEAVRAAERAGLYVALTCREGPGRADFNRSHEIWRDAAAQDAYVRMWRQIASHYHGRASIVGYDLMCEPHPDKEAGQPLGDWNALARKITVAIRTVDERAPILVNSIGWAYPQQFEVLRLTGDPRTVYTVHFYDPTITPTRSPERMSLTQDSAFLTRTHRSGTRLFWRPNSRWFALFNWSITCRFSWASLAAPAMRRGWRSGSATRWTSTKSTGGPGLTGLSGSGTS